MATDWLDKTDFPSGPEGFGYDLYAPWVHPVTKAVYLWDYNKNSWLLFANNGARLYSSTIDPALDAVVLYDGDLWWDSRALELRVYHRPIPHSPGIPVTGRWVSSTNPEMSLTDTDRNLVIGIVELDAPSTSVYEGREAIFRVDRPQGGVDDSMLDYEWVVNPNPLTVPSGSNPGDFYVIVSDPYSPITSMTWTPGTYRVDDDGQIPFTVYCKVSAKEEFEDSFVNPKARTEVAIVYPKPEIIDPIDHVNMIGGDSGTMQFINGSSDVQYDGPGEYQMTGPTTGTRFHVIPDDATVANNPGILFTTSDPGDVDFDPNSAVYVGSQYMAATAPIIGYDEAERPSGYTIELEGYDMGTDTVLYAYDPNSVNYNFRAALTVKAR